MYIERLDLGVGVGVSECVIALAQFLAQRLINR
jgi:hypothetical protein